ncbi:MAG: hypothetical protein FH753_02675 [Firmicutes bacterium]|nr:hypothetical protein [Bacillota bacterium]
MNKYFLIIYILAIIFGSKNLILEIKKRIYDRKVTITNGLKKYNYTQLIGILYMTTFIIFCISFYRNPLEKGFILLGTMCGILGVKELIIGIKNEIREDGIYTNKGIYKWNEIIKYEWMEIKKRRSLLNSSLEYSSLRFYVDKGYPKKIIIDVAMEDIEKTEIFFDEIGLTHKKDKKID